MLNAIINHYANGSKARMARILDVTPQAISTWLSRNKLDIELVFAKCEGINPEWLFTGKGSMLRINKIVDQPLTITKKDIVAIPLVDISVAAGFGYDNPSYLEVIDTIDLPTTMVNQNSTYFCVKARGESMVPTILDSSYIVVRLLDRTEWKDMPEEHVYVVSDREGKAYIKRIKNRLSQKGFIVCMSDNPDKFNYPNFNIQEDEINTILYAEWYFTAKFPNIHQSYYQKVSMLEDKYLDLEDKLEKFISLHSKLPDKPHTRTF